MSPSPRRPTSADVAARAGVSRATVSMVLNGRVAGTVAPATERRVREAAQQLGYARSAIALSLRESRTRTVGLITDEIATSPWAGRMVRAASQVAAEHDHMVVSVDLSLRESNLADAVRVLAERQVDGLMLATMGRSEVDLPGTTHGLPLVLLNASSRAATSAGAVPAMVPDDRGGAERAVRRLLDVGHRRIVMLSGDDAQVATRERELGALDAARGGDAQVRVIPAGWQMSDGFRETERLLAGPDAPTALFCIRDRVAAGALHAVTRAGRDVPADLSVIGFDDEDFFAEMLTPPLTTIALPHEEMGRRAMQRLLGLVRDEESPRAAADENLEVIACPLVERGSVAAPR